MKGTEIVGEKESVIGKLNSVSKFCMNFWTLWFQTDSPTVSNKI